jgi:hypothetical protein
MFWALNENNFCPRILSFKIDGAIKIFHRDRNNTIYDHYRRFYKEFCTQKMKGNKTKRRQEVSNYRGRKDK